MTPTLLTALAIGFLGSTHCIGMCGGIVGALNAGLPPFHARSNLLKAIYNLLYNAGRIVSYCLAGAGLGLLAEQSSALAINAILPVGELIAGAFLIALGFYIGGWNSAIIWLERLGQYFWKFIQPFGKHFMPVQSPAHAFGLGLVWGWLPCGLVYSALALAMTTGSATDGAVVMLVFGLGTLPVLMVMGPAATFLKNLIQKSTLRRGAGMAVMLFGVYTAVTAFEPHEHGANHERAAPHGHSSE
ncbi:MAG: sulfite exporter TauE/SafE family protein [Alphaproteobacteria bacterium]|jgi:uncharacterized protein|nr:sulfite exporter TauE/SafE family protein [Alphaproteobacteria bacterium]MBT4016703.1 sulfite exporter TauE/SafE family protein [Alphaproteobacteria bacterium]MBT4966617.1 sulfite exporter TauE/SafE family protein [Alphaproteobacteria bacterium]MBT5159894.1 sulfite exporter TauE/SafE family protein [Alphaproteobacteria bacterium]MBT6384507.1 sulfite exporter TauE/SafE family protein [Alphaproteobacteria bacterium]